MRWQAFLAVVLLLVAGCAFQSAQAADPSGGIRFDSRSRTWTNTHGARSLPAVVSPVTTSAPAPARARDEFIEYTLSPPPTTRPAPSPSRAGAPIVSPAPQAPSPVTAVSDRIPVPAVIETWGWNNAAPNLGVTSMPYGGYGYAYGYASPYYAPYGSYTGMCMSTPYATNQVYASYAPPLPYGTGSMAGWGPYANGYGGGIYVLGSWNQSGWRGDHPQSCAPNRTGTHPNRPGGYPARPHPVPHRR